MDRFIGKFVCFGNKEGRFCWGKIKSVVKINTMDGIREAFVLTDRMSGPHDNIKVVRQAGNTLVRVDQLNLDKDIVDTDDIWKDFSDEELFLILLQNNQDDVLKNDANRMSQGLQNMISSEAFGCASDMAGSVLKKRMGRQEES